MLTTLLSTGTTRNLSPGLPPRSPTASLFDGLTTVRRISSPSSPGPLPSSTLDLDPWFKPSCTTVRLHPTSSGPSQSLSPRSPKSPSPPSQSSPRSLSPRLLSPRLLLLSLVFPRLPPPPALVPSCSSSQRWQGHQDRSQGRHHHRRHSRQEDQRFCSTRPSLDCFCFGSTRGRQPRSRQVRH